MRNKWVHIRRIDRDRLPHLIMKYQPCGKETKYNTSKDFSTVNGTGRGHEAQNPACYMMVMMMMVIIIIIIITIMVVMMRKSLNQAQKKFGNISEKEM